MEDRGGINVTRFEKWDLRSPLGLFCGKRKTNPFGEKKESRSLYENKDTYGIDFSCTLSIFFLFQCGLTLFKLNIAAS